MSAEAGRNPGARARVFADALAAAIGAVIGVPADVTGGAGAGSADWTMTIGVGGPTAGAVTLALPAIAAARLTQLATPTEADPDESAIRHLLQRLTDGLVTALGPLPQARDWTLSAEPPTVGSAAPLGESAAYTIAVGPDATIDVTIWVEGIGAEAVADPPAAADAAASARPPLSIVSSRVPSMDVPANLDVILDIDLPLSVRFGQTELTLEHLAQLGPGSVIDLGRSPEEHVDVLVNGRLVARGEVVVVSGNYGVRILEVVSTADRMRTFGQ
jgi:flagellar motor switch protein FliN/FliY